ncbi:MAG: glycosyltransferase [Candidatus Bathyarchaeota archaeon]|nr:glycosyltransferase [Candidatus Bathyarchaeota archaeon]
MEPEKGNVGLQMKGQVLILVGGGGHAGYAYALAQVLHNKMNLSFIVPEGDKLSEKRLKKFGKVKFLIKPRGPKTSTQQFIPRLAKSFIESLGQPFNEFDVVVSSGSNFCVVPSIMAWMRGVPVVSMESPVRFTKASRTARILQNFAAVTALHWEEQKKILKGTVVGPIFPKVEVNPENQGYILVTGGTHGHKLLFKALDESNLTNVVLQTGKNDPKPFAERHPEWKVLDFTDKFQELIAGAEVVVTHFGLTALEAAVVYKKPVVMVLNPEWTRTVGAEDAKIFAKKLNAVFISESTVETLTNAIIEAKTKKPLNLPSGAENLAKIIVDLANNKRK